MNTMFAFNASMLILAAIGGSIVWDEWTKQRGDPRTVRGVVSVLVNEPSGVLRCLLSAVPVGWIAFFLSNHIVESLLPHLSRLLQ